MTTNSLTVALATPHERSWSPPDPAARYGSDTRKIVLGWSAVVGIAAALISIVVLAVLKLPVWIGLIIGAVTGVAAGYWRFGKSDAIAAATLGAKPLAESDAPRLFNIVDGLSLGSGIPAPAIWAVSSPSINAASFGTDPNRPNVVITTGALESCTLMELQGLVALELVKVRRGETKMATVLISFLTSLGLGGVAQRFHTADTANWIAVDAASITRFPPGLIDALTRARGVGSSVSGVRDASLPAWTIEPRAGEHAEVADRQLDQLIDILREL